jgi:hypothetical protein
MESFMTQHHVLAARRGWVLSLLCAVALAAALATVSAGPDHDASATEPGRTDGQTAGHLASAHAVSTSAPAARLLANQVDIGDVIKPFYGEAAGDQLTTLLNGHIGIAVELLQAAKAGDTTTFEQARAEWYANSDQIADFLASANPKYWPQDVMRAAMTAHLDQTLAEAAHGLSGQYTASVADYDEIHPNILEMADLLSDGIIRTFPKRFSSR